MKRLFNAFANPSKIGLHLLRSTCRFWPDKAYLQVYHRLMTGHSLNLDNPQTYSEKCQWMKLYYQRPELNMIVDKYEVKKYIADKIGQEYVVECYGVWDNFDDIDFESLPNRFILKCTKDSGGFVICKDKSTFDIVSARNKLEEGMKKNYFYQKREWAYKNVKPRILAEKYMDSLGRPDSIEYKITCMNGKVEFVTICGGIAHGLYEQRSNDHYTRDWKKMDWYARYKPSGKDYPLTPEIKKMIELSEVITQGFPQVRADWYVHEGNIYFGELTFYTWAGWPLFTPEEWDLKLGKNFVLPKEKYIEKH